MPTTLYWHDYETFGADPRRDRPAQFAGIRTDEAFNEIGKPLVIYCKPARDVLPHPEACLLTGITPQIAAKRGLIEPEFIAHIHSELAQPNTCGIGYNSIRFDDEITRYTLYRNFYDPYAREWQQGNSRWDIIDLARMTYALRPSGIEWPQHDDQPSFRLGDLVSANGISHETAHDALSDVRATIGLAQLLHDQQPRLYDWLFQLRNKRKASAQLDIVKHTPVLHTSCMYPATSGCTTLVMPLVTEPGNNNSILVYDLRHNPSDFIDMDVSDLSEHLFTRTVDLPQGAQRLPIKSIKINKCPALAPLNTLNTSATERIDIDLDTCHQHWQQLCSNTNFIQRVALAYTSREFEPESDVDLALYNNFLDKSDYPLMTQVRHASPQELSQNYFDFHDKRLHTLLFRYRARNWPETLTSEEMQEWDQIRQQRFKEIDGGGSITLQNFSALVDSLRNKYKKDRRVQKILNEMNAWQKELSE